jgi:hypothetical protein
MAIRNKNKNKNGYHAIMGGSPRMKCLSAAQNVIA